MIGSVWPLALQQGFQFVCAAGQHAGANPMPAAQRLRLPILPGRQGWVPSRAACGEQRSAWLPGHDNGHAGYRGGPRGVLGRQQAIQ